jgi:hypothetical protein
MPKSIVVSISESLHGGGKKGMAAVIEGRDGRMEWKVTVFAPPPKKKIEWKSSVCNISMASLKRDCI